MRHVYLAVVLVCGLVFSTTASALQVPPEGVEFQVNTYTSSSQTTPAVCRDAAGNFVVVWRSYGQDGDGRGVFAQRFSSAGTPQGTEFQVNTYTPDDQQAPELCCDAGGNFVVVWQSNTQDGDIRGVFGQRFSSAGTPQGTEFQVNTYTTDTQSTGAICCDASGDFVVAWDSRSEDGGNYGV